MKNLIFRPMTAAETEYWYHNELAEACPPQERKPLPVILNMMDEGRYAVWGLWDGSVLLGYAALWSRPGVPLVLLDYLGVTAARRNGGLGGHLLRLLKEQGVPLVMESELPRGDEGDPIRLRRIAFYVRNGFTPLYVMATCGMAWQALVSHPEVGTEATMAHHRALYGPERRDVRIPLPPGEQPEMPDWV